MRFFSLFFALPTRLFSRRRRKKVHFFALSGGPGGSLTGNFGIFLHFFAFFRTFGVPGGVPPPPRGSGGVPPLDRERGGVPPPKPEFGISGGGTPPKLGGGTPPYFPGIRGGYPPLPGIPEFRTFPCRICKSWTKFRLGFRVHISVRKCVTGIFVDNFRQSLQNLLRKFAIRKFRVAKFCDMS